MVGGSADRDDENTPEKDRCRGLRDCQEVLRQDPCRKEEKDVLRQPHAHRGCRKPGETRIRRRHLSVDDERRTSLRDRGGSVREG